jgi:hypothetical protein
MDLNWNKKRIARGKLRSFLGKTAGELTRVMGEPFASYSYRDSEVYLYDSKPVTTVALHNGVIVKCNDLADARRHLRVQPLQNIAVVSRGEASNKGQLKDISIGGAAVSFPTDVTFAIRDTTVLTFSLPIEGIDRFLEIPCRVKDIRAIDGVVITVFLFDFSSIPREKAIITRYISLRKIQAELDLDDSFLWKKQDEDAIRPLHMN